MMVVRYRRDPELLLQLEKEQVGIYISWKELHKVAWYLNPMIVGFGTGGCVTSTSKIWLG